MMKNFIICSLQQIFMVLYVRYVADTRILIGLFINSNDQR